jgi:cell division protein FtsL
MTPPGSRSATAAAPSPPKRASATPRVAPRRAPSRHSPPTRRISGPLAPAQHPQRRSARAAPSGRLAAFLRALPDHPLLDRIVRGRFWIPLLGVMLVGIVAMQVELLKLNASTGRSIELISSLQGRNDMLRAEVASASNPDRIERLAGRLGMTMPGPEAITFVSAHSASVGRAISGIHLPDAAVFQAAAQASGATATQPNGQAATQTSGQAGTPTGGQAGTQTSSQAGTQTSTSSTPGAPPATVP